MPHMSTLALSVGPAGELRSCYSYFLVGALHLCASGVYDLGDIYHSLEGPESLELSSYGQLFGYQ